MGNNEKSPFSDCLAAEENGLSISHLNNRLERYGSAKNRTLEMANYIKNAVIRNNETAKLVTKLNTCACYLIFKHYYTLDEVRLHSMKTCDKSLLCPFCAIRRGAKYVQAYSAKVGALCSQNANLSPYFVTITVKDGENLLERFNHLIKSDRKYKQQRRDALKGQRFVEFSKALGGVSAIEFKRGKNSGLWHPHQHSIWLCEEKPDARKISAEWQAITGDSFIVDVRPMHGEIDGFLETFKYALKFTDMPLDDNWTGYEQLRTKRLISSFGVLRGVDVPEDLTDEDLAEDLPFMLMMYKFKKGSGFNYVESL